MKEIFMKLGSWMIIITTSLILLSSCATTRETPDLQSFQANSLPADGGSQAALAAAKTY